jgi:hypothetical protein
VIKVEGVAVEIAIVRNIARLGETPLGESAIDPVVVRVVDVLGPLEEVGDLADLSLGGSGLQVRVGLEIAAEQGTIQTDVRSCPHARAAMNPQS